jgi:hypothetical protein
MQGTFGGTPAEYSLAADAVLLVGAPCSGLAWPHTALMMSCLHQCNPGQRESAKQQQSQASRWLSVYNQASQHRLVGSQMLVAFQQNAQEAMKRRPEPHELVPMAQGQPQSSCLMLLLPMGWVVMQVFQCAPSPSSAHGRVFGL